MPVTFALKDEVGIFTTIGNVEFEQGFLVLNQGMMALQRLAAPQRMLFDIRLSTEQRSSDELRELVLTVGKLLPRARMALVADSDYMYGMSRMFSQLASANDLCARVFDSMENAKAWLATDNNN